MDQLPDVQALMPDTRFKLNRVGVSGVRKLVRVQRHGRAEPIVLTATFDIAVDLPPTMKGSHMSRNVESVASILEQSTAGPVNGLEDLTAAIAEDLLERHDYAHEAEVKATAEYFVERETPFDTRSTEWFTLMSEALAKRGGRTRTLIGVEVTGTSACPCAMETARTLAGGKSDGTPGLTHNQRNLGTLLVEVRPEAGVEADRLIDAVEAAQSAPTFELLKRKSEGQLVLQAHEHPKFVEDVVRGILRNVLDAFPDMPDDAVLYARSVSQESIHKHDAFAERETTFGELRSNPT